MLGRSRGRPGHPVATTSALVLATVLTTALTTGPATGLGATSVASSAEPPAPEPAHGAAAGGISTETFEQKVLRQINKRRSARDLRRIRTNACLDGYAEDWAETIALTGLLVHRDQTIILNACDLTWAGENLARGDLTPRSTVQAWMDSPSHKKVMLKRRANRAGVGVQVDAQDRTVVVLNLGDRS